MLFKNLLKRHNPELAVFVTLPMFLVAGCQANSQGRGYGIIPSQRQPFVHVVDEDGFPPPAELSDRIRTSLKQGIPVLAMLFVPDGSGTAAAQCTGAAWGTLYAPMGEWTPEIRLDTDCRSGGCFQAFAVYDPENVLAGLNLFVHLPQVINQCGEAGIHYVPIFQESLPEDGNLNWGDIVRIDTDDRPGGCPMNFQALGRDDIVLEIQFWPDGDSGQCGENIAGGVGIMTAGNEGGVSLYLDMDDRPGGCRQRFRLRKL